jgi:hypothetical protein
MKLDEALKTIQEIISCYDTSYSDYHEERVASQVKFIILTLKIKVDDPAEPRFPRIPPKTA